MKFVDNLETIIRADIKDEQSKTDIVLRSLSRSSSSNGGFQIDFARKLSDVSPIHEVNESNFNDSRVSGNFGSSVIQNRLTEMEH